jgi:DeoR/GlpR family transcriptional regulator of sugar metabolism
MKLSRQSEIVAALDSQGLLNVKELSDRFSVSEMTIRRDLLDLELSGLIRRVHGGATRMIGRAYEPPFRMRQASFGGHKRAIAHAAAALIVQGDAIGLDVGTTTLEMVPAFVEVDNLTVVTASLRVAYRVAEMHALEHSIRLMVTGGVTRADELSLIGQSAIDFYRRIRLDKAFVSVGCVSLSGDTSEFNLEDAEVKRAMIASSNEVILLVDSSKFHQTGFAHVVDLSEVSTLITDSDVDEATLAQLQDQGVNVVVAESSAP